MRRKWFLTSITSYLSIISVELVIILTIYQFLDITSLLNSQRLIPLPVGFTAILLLALSVIFVLPIAQFSFFTFYSTKFNFLFKKNVWFYIWGIGGFVFSFWMSMYFTGNVMGTSRVDFLSPQIIPVLFVHYILYYGILLWVIFDPFKKVLRG